MKTFFVTWRDYDWQNLPQLAFQIKKHGHVLYSWSFRAHRMSSPGSRVFLLNLRDHPGIMGAGWIVSEPYYKRHWRTDRSTKGEKVWRVKIDWEVLRVPGKDPIFPRERLNHGILRNGYWNTQGCGISVPPKVALELERQWARFLGRPPRIALVTRANIKAYEGGHYETKAFRHGRSRWLRDQAIDASGGICEGCSVNFSRLLDGDGVRALQVHHKKQLAYCDRPKLTRLTDLNVVCANCHSFIHADSKKAISVAVLRRCLRKA